MLRRLLTQPDLKLTPADDPMWDKNDHNGISDEFVWNNTASPFLLIYLARLPFIFISWLLGALIFRWASERAGAWAGVFALALYVFDPNLLAHSRLAMTDFAPTAIACFALYAFDRWLQQMNESQVARGHRHFHGLDAGLKVLVDHVRPGDGDLGDPSLALNQISVHQRRSAFYSFF